MSPALPVRPSGHLGSRASAYVDRSLPAPEMLALDRHLGVCIACRATADDERRLLSSLRSTSLPTPSASLSRALLDVAVMAGPPAGVVRRSPWPEPSSDLVLRPPVRTLPVLAIGAPPMHRSPVRAAVAAGLAAGVSAAAAFGLGVAGLTSIAGPATAPAPTTSPAARLGSSGMTGTSSLAATTAFPFGTGSGRHQWLTAVHLRSHYQAQSTP